MDVAATPLSETQIAAAQELLREAPFAYLAVVEPGGPYVVPLNFAYVASGGPGADGSAAAEATHASPATPVPSRPGPPGLDGRIFFHTGEGRKTRALTTDPRVCLAVTASSTFVQGDRPCGDGFSFRSLLVWGQARLVEQDAPREAALRAIVRKYDPGAAEVPFEEADFARTLLYEVTIEAASYKERKPPATG